MKSTSDPHAVKRLILALHRDLGFLFAAVVIVYAVSGILMNHRDSINPNYCVDISEVTLPSDFPSDKESVTENDIMRLAATVDESDNLIKHYFSKGDLKLLFKGGSNMVVDLNGRTATYERVSRRLIISDMVRLHYNPGGWWSLFSDIFAICLILITLTGLFIIKGRKGLVGRGGILLLLGILVPIIFLLASN